MGDAGSTPPRRMSYARFRRLVIVAGLAILALVAAFTYARGVDPKEVTATLLFIPIFFAFVVGKVPGGVVAGVVGALIYAALRLPDMQAVGVDRYSSLITSRALAFIAFGAIGGWASRRLSESVAKLELYDQIDDQTGLFNARFFGQDTELEVTRSSRYQTIFSVVVVDIPSPALEVLSRRQKSGLLKELGRILQASIRTVDRGVHASDGRRHRLAVVLPETGREGAAIFAGRLEARLTDYLKSRGVSGGELESSFCTHPGDEQALERLRVEFSAIEAAEHPPAPEPAKRERGASR